MADLTIRQSTATRAHPERSLQLALAAARTAIDYRGQDVIVLDVRQQTSLFDYFVLATGTSGRQLRAMSEEIDHTLEDDLGDHRMGIEGFAESHWIVLDYGSVVIHLFDEEARQYYLLEELWAEGKRVDLSHLLEDQVRQPSHRSEKR